MKDEWAWSALAAQWKEELDNPGAHLNAAWTALAEAALRAYGVDLVPVDEAP